MKFRSFRRSQIFFKGSVSDEFISRLNDLVKGPFSYSEEKEDGTKSRNRLFELLVSSRIEGLGSVDFSTDADIVILGSCCEFVVECKRPFSSSSIVRNYKRASSQLTRRFAEKPLAKRRGIIAIDLTKPINPKFEFVVVRSAQDVDATVHKIIYDEISKIESELVANTRHGVLGVLFRFSCFVRCDQDKTIIYCQRYSVFPTCSIGSEEKRAIRGQVLPRASTRYQRALENLSISWR